MSRMLPERSSSGRASISSQARVYSMAKPLAIARAGVHSEEFLRSKAPRPNSSVAELGDLHPRFKSNRISNQLGKKQASSPCIRWTCPPKFIINSGWCVAAGEESEVRRIQTKREPGQIDYPSIIPSSLPIPSLSMEVDDEGIPIIPLIPIEEVEAKQNASQLAALKPSGKKTDSEADITAAASAAFTALVKSKEQGSMIDTNLLIQILSNPNMIEFLKAGEKTPIPNQDKPLMIQPASRNPVQPLSLLSDLILLLKQVCENQNKILKQAQTAPGSVNLAPLTPSADLAVPNSITTQPLPIRDENYYKSLVRQHGVEEQGHEEGQKRNSPQVDTRNSLEAAKKVQKKRKSCFFFNSDQGCRNGATCPYKHNVLSTPRVRDRKPPEPEAPKKIKFTGEVCLRMGQTSE